VARRQNTLRLIRTDGRTRGAGATMEELTWIAGPWKWVTGWRVTEFDPPRRQVQQGEGISTAKNMAVIIELSPAGHQFHPHRPLYAAVRAGRRALDNHRPGGPRFHYSFSAAIGAGVRRARSTRELKFLNPRLRRADTPASAATGLAPCRPGGPIAHHVHHDSEQSRHFCASPPQRTHQQCRPVPVWATPVSTSHVAKRQHLAAWGWPYSGPRAAGISGVNAGESRGPCRRPGRTRLQVRGSVILAGKCRSGTLTRKRSLVQIQYGPRHFSKTCPALKGPRGASHLRFCRFIAGQSTPGCGPE